MAVKCFDHPVLKIINNLIVEIIQLNHHPNAAMYYLKTTCQLVQRQNSRRPSKSTSTESTPSRS